MEKLIVENVNDGIIGRLVYGVERPKINTEEHIDRIISMIADQIDLEEKENGKDEGKN